MLSTSAAVLMRTSRKPGDATSQQPHRYRNPSARSEQGAVGSGKLWRPTFFHAVNNDGMSAVGPGNTVRGRSRLLSQEQHGMSTASCEYLGFWDGMDGMTTASRIQHILLHIEYVQHNLLWAPG